MNKKKNFPHALFCRCHWHCMVQSEQFTVSSNNYNYIGGTDGWSFFFSSLSNLAWSIDEADGNPHGNSRKSISNCIMFSASTVEIHNTKYKPGWIHTYEVRRKYVMKSEENIYTYEIWGSHMSVAGYIHIICDVMLFHMNAEKPT